MGDVNNLSIQFTYKSCYNMIVKILAFREGKTTGGKTYFTGSRSSVLEKVFEYLRRSLTVAWKSVFFNFKQYFCFFVAILIVQVLYGMMTVSAEVRFNPVPPAFKLSRKRGIAGSLLK